jgi:protein-tyrosine kinase
MEHIRQAIERAKESGAAVAQPHGPMPSHLQRAELRPGSGGIDSAGGAVPTPSHAEFALSEKHLEAKRVVSHDIADSRSRAFDMLRTQVLQTMDTKSWQLVGVTSPTAGCGKTTISVNLALSIARQPHRSVLLVDLDLQKPQVANTLGIKSEDGLLSVLEGKTRLQDALIRARFGQESFLVLPCAQ